MGINPILVKYDVKAQISIDYNQRNKKSCCYKYINQNKTIVKVYFPMVSWGLSECRIGE